MTHMPRHALAAALALLLAACGQGVGPGNGPGDPTVEDPTVEDPGLDDPRLADITLELVADGFDSPLAVTHAWDGSGRIFVVERGGTVRAVQGGTVQETPYLDVGHLLAPPEGENGLLGLAFHPDFSENGRLFARYVDVDLANVVVEFRAATPGASTVDAGTVAPLLDATPDSAFHQGGHLAFGADGYLYVALGDGGRPETARDLGTLHGSILRIDVDDGEAPYAVPPDDPHLGVAGALPEIWASGLRNPWRFSFDAATGDMWIADVGQNSVEEINLERAGDPGGHDYGWPIVEGDRCYGPPEGCPTDDLARPVLTYDHGDGWGRAVIGGYVYRGEELPVLRGAYVFGDYVSGGVFAAREWADGWQAVPILEGSHASSSFGIDEALDLYLVDFSGGGLHRLASEAP